MDATRTRGFAGFGSFMTDKSVPELIEAASSSDYASPPHPFDDTEVTSLIKDLSEATPLGLGARGLYQIDFDAYTFINHGAFGSVCLPAHCEGNLWRAHCERQPLRFLDRQLFPALVDIHMKMGRMIHSRPSDLVLVPNATTGLNVVIKSVLQRPEDLVYLLDITYGSVKKMVQSTGCQVVMPSIDLSSLTSARDIVALVKETLPFNTKLAIFDHITSNTAIRLPVKDLINLCHERNVLVLIDGAHALGSIPLDMGEMNADFYVTNCHKWLCGPRGSAILWAREDTQALLHPLTVSHGAGSNRTLVEKFIWDGNRDYSSYLSLSSTLDMWDRLGIDRCNAYCETLLAEAVQVLTGGWGTSTLVPLSLCGVRMALVGFPWEKSEARNATDVDVKFIQDALFHSHRIEVPVKLISGRVYIRISVQIYNTIQDYVKLKDAVKALCESDLFIAHESTIQVCSRGGGCG